MSWREPTCGVYCITNTVSGKKYVGSSRRIERRWGTHLRAAFTGVKGALYEDIRAEGPDAFSREILQRCDHSELLKFERAWIVRLGTIEPRGYNRANAGGGMPSREMLVGLTTEERREWNEKLTRRGLAGSAAIAAKRADPEYDASYRAVRRRAAILREERLRAKRASDPALGQAYRARQRKASLSRGVCHGRMG